MKDFDDHARAIEHSCPRRALEVSSLAWRDFVIHDDDSRLVECLVASVVLHRYGLRGVFVRAFGRGGPLRPNLRLDLRGTGWNRALPPRELRQLLQLSLA